VRFEECVYKGLVKRDLRAAERVENSLKIAERFLKSAEEFLKTARRKLGGF